MPFLPLGRTRHRLNDRAQTEVVLESFCVPALTIQLSFDFTFTVSLAVAMCQVK